MPIGCRTPHVRSTFVAVLPNHKLQTPALGCGVAHFHDLVFFWTGVGCFAAISADFLGDKIMTGLKMATFSASKVGNSISRNFLDFSRLFSLLHIFSRRPFCSTPRKYRAGKHFYFTHGFTHHCELFCSKFGGELGYRIRNHDFDPQTR